MLRRRHPPPEPPANAEGRGGRLGDWSYAGVEGHRVGLVAAQALGEDVGVERVVDRDDGVQLAVHQPLQFLDVAVAGGERGGGAHLGDGVVHPRVAQAGAVGGGDVPGVHPPVHDRVRPVPQVEAGEDAEIAAQGAHVERFHVELDDLDLDADARGLGLDDLGELGELGDGDDQHLRLPRLALELDEAVAVGVGQPRRGEQGLGLGHVVGEELLAVGQVHVLEGGRHHAVGGDALAE